MHDHLTQRCCLRQVLRVLNGEVLVVPGAQLALVLFTAGAAQRPTVHIGHDVESLAGTHRGVLPDLPVCHAPARRVPRRNIRSPSRASTMATRPAKAARRLPPVRASSLPPPADVLDVECADFATDAAADLAPLNG